MKRFKMMKNGELWAQAEAPEQAPAAFLAAWEGSGCTLVVEDITDEHALRECHLKRVKEYPPMVDFADAHYHLTVNGDPSKMDAYLAKVAAVKAKYPKP